MVGAYLSSFSFGAFPNRLDQQLMVEIASLLLMAAETDAPMQNKRGRGGLWVELRRKLVRNRFDLYTNLFPLLYSEISFATVLLLRSSGSHCSPFWSTVLLCSCLSLSLRSLFFFTRWPLVLFPSLQGQAGAWHLIESIFYYDSARSVWGFTTPL